MVTLWSNVSQLFDGSQNPTYEEECYSTQDNNQRSPIPLVLAHGGRIAKVQRVAPDGWITQWSHFG